MKEFTFDCKLQAALTVTARSKEEAMGYLINSLDCVTIRIAGLTRGEASLMNDEYGDPAITYAEDLEEKDE